MEDKEAKAKEQARVSLLQRTISTAWMIGGFCLLLYVGHFACLCLVFGIQILIFKELKKLNQRLRQSTKNSFHSWLLFGIFVYYFDVWLFWHFFEGQLQIYAPIKFLIKYHNLIGIMSYFLVFVSFVMSLTKETYSTQITSLVWTHMTLLFTSFPAYCCLKDIHYGIFWLVIPQSMIIANDIFAFVFGKLFGRTQLIELSPKKTVEGFVGGLFATILWSVFACYLASFQHFICPKTDLWMWKTQCSVFPVFTAQSFPLLNMSFPPVYFHVAVLALFASLIAPFGGLFGSGIKRSLGIKDFGDSIPGHGGLTDRFDCHLVMCAFALVYVETFVVPS